MAGFRSLECDVDRFWIAHFSDVTLRRAVDGEFYPRSYQEAECSGAREGATVVGEYRSLFVVLRFVA